MNKSEIVSELKKTNYDEFSCDILGDSILEFQELFKEEFVKTNVAIEQICKNIPKGIVIYENDDDVFDATCSISDGEFKVNKETTQDMNYFRYLMFHEMLHAISFKDFMEHNIFMGFYSADNGEEYEYKSIAFNEAFTEFMTLKRNKMVGFEFDGSLSGYELGVQKIEMITKIIPENELIDAYFNHPYELEKIFEENGLNLDDAFYAIHLLEGKQKSESMLEQKRGLDEPNDALKIVEANRIMLCNLSDALGKPENEEEFIKKWLVLLSERNMKYKFWDIDGIGCFTEFLFDLYDLELDESQISQVLEELKIPEDIFYKYRMLCDIFGSEEKYGILQGLLEIYKNDYDEYFELLRDDAPSLCYRFFDSIPNNFFLYDIELYPRLAQYLNEDDDIDSIKYQKIRCENQDINFYVFTIGSDRIIECEYDNVNVEQEEENLYKVTFDDDSYAYILCENNNYFYDLPSGKIIFDIIYSK